MAILLASYEGKHANKVKTSVRIINIPTGLVAQCTEERSWFHNKQRDMGKLPVRLVDLQKEQEAKQVNTAWREHTHIVRGNPLRIYEGKKIVQRKQ